MPPHPNPLLRRSHELGLLVTILLVVAAAPELEASGGVHAENETPAVALGANFDPLPVATAVYVPNDGAYEANARVGPAGEPFTFHR